MTKEFFDVEITFGASAPVKLTGLTRGQMDGLKALFDAAPGQRQWRTLQHRFGTTWGERINVAWRRLNAWMMVPLILLAVLSVPATAQRAVEPVRVSVVTSAEPESPDAVRQFHTAFKTELGKVRDVSVTGRGDFDIYLTASTLTKDDNLRGYAVVVLVIADAKPKEHYWLTVRTGGDLQALTRDVVKDINRAVFDSFRRRKQ